MSEHREAKNEVLGELGSNLEIALKGFIGELRFPLHGKGLISDDARDKKDAGQMVSDIQNRVRGNEALWDELLTVLRKKKIREDLLEALSKKTGPIQKRPRTDGRAARKFKTKVKF